MTISLRQTSRQQAWAHTVLHPGLTQMQSLLQRRVARSENENGKPQRMMQSMGSLGAWTSRASAPLSMSTALLRHQSRCISHMLKLVAASIDYLHVPFTPQHRQNGFEIDCPNGALTSEDDAFTRCSLGTLSACLLEHTLYSIQQPLSWQPVRGRVINCRPLHDRCSEHQQQNF